MLGLIDRRESGYFFFFLFFFFFFKIKSNVV